MNDTPAERGGDSAWAGPRHRKIVRSGLAYAAVLPFVSTAVREKLSVLRSSSTLIVLFMGGGSIYILPYLSTYLYIPMKDAMHLDNMQIGLMGSAMGIASMIFYWPGGWVADHFSPRKLAIGVISWVCLPETGATSSTASKNKGTIPLRSAISQVVRLPVWLVVAKTQCSPFRDENNEEEARVSTKATRSIPQR